MINIIQTLYFIVFTLVLLNIIFGKSIRVFLKKGAQKNEFDKWLKNDELKFRNLHTYPDDWGIRREYVASRDRFTCRICSRKGWLGFHVHHLKPLSNGGTNDPANLIYLCKICHENQHEHMLKKRN